MTVEFEVPRTSRQPALRLRPWLAHDMPALVAEMGRDYPTGGLWPNRNDRPDRRTWTGPRDVREAAEWLAGQDDGWCDGDWLTFAVLAREPAGDGHDLAGHVGLKNREPGDRVGQAETAEISYWTAAGYRGRGIAPAVVRVVTAWAFGTFASARLREIMLVHNIDNLASCKVAEKASYPFKAFSPANPPFWHEDGHIHLRIAGPTR